ncbi:MAG: hypothetical protein LCH30_11500 [Proteobacteria bacterium]|nr:hypothetical protein [Pseudomonadota bacterium]
MELAFGRYDIRKFNIWGAIIENPDLLNQTDKYGCSLIYYWYEVEPVMAKKLLEMIRDEKPDFIFNFNIIPIDNCPYSSITFFHLIAIRQDFDFFSSFILDNMQIISLLNSRIGRPDHPYFGYTLADLFTKNEASLQGWDIALPQTDMGLILLNNLLKKAMAENADFTLVSSLKKIELDRLIQLQLGALLSIYAEKNPPTFHQNTYHLEDAVPSTSSGLSQFGTFALTHTTKAKGTNVMIDNFNDKENALNGSNTTTNFNGR